MRVYAKDNPEAIMRVPAGEPIPDAYTADEPPPPDQGCEVRNIDGCWQQVPIREPEPEPIEPPPDPLHMRLDRQQVGDLIRELGFEGVDDGEIDKAWLEIALPPDQATSDE